MIFIGVDPGQGGGIAALMQPGIRVISMPQTERGIWDALAALAAYDDCYAAIEKVHSMPGQGVASMFKFGWNYGMVRMALIGNHIPFDEVTPQAWMKALQVPPADKRKNKQQNKDRMLALGQQWYPKLKVWQGTLRKQRAIADALLIAHYIKRKEQGQL